jgi:hypothetical protein
MSRRHQSAVLINKVSGTTRIVDRPPETSALTAFVFEDW